MSTIEIPPADYPAEIIGYAEPWIVSPGDTVSIKVSCTEPEYTYQTVRVVQGVDVEHSPKKEEEVIGEIAAGQCKGKFQLARPGSYGIVENWLPIPVSLVNGLKISLYMQPWLPLSGHPQTAISTLDASSKTGFAVVINEAGSIDLWIGTGEAVETIATGFSPEKKRWLKVSIVLQGTDVSVSIIPLSLFATPGTAPLAMESKLQSPMKTSATDSLLFGASFADSPTSVFPRATNFFNGRIDSPSIKTPAAPFLTLVKYDFSQKISTDSFVDISGHGRDGKLVNAPTRAVKGYDWDGTECDFVKATYGYGAIHFHDDDLDDACWETDFTITVPENARSGVYAVNLASTNGKTIDSVPFFVRPGKEASKQREGKVAFILSTFTYLAYANEHLYDAARSSAIDVGPGFDSSDIALSEDFSRMQRRIDLGLSAYDVHNDDSGVVFSSSKRPILNLRPGYVMWAFKRPREFSADTMMIGFLEREKIPYEVITDHDLHEYGVSALTGFNTVITGSHPEYPSAESYNAYISFAKQGGNMMYLGGNGFYWVTAADMAARPHRVEIRRGDQGVRSFTLPGGERISSTNGRMGGLWRGRGKSCNAIFGIGFCGEGAGPGVPYRRSEASKTDESVAWMFEGIPPEGLIGEFGLGGGASGDEIDRFDVKHDSPESVKVLASSTGHPDAFGIAPEDAPFPILNTLGTQNPNIRSDISYYISSGGGGVFSVGSINWFCSLGWDDYANSVAQLTGNLIKGFLKGLR